MQLPLVSKVGLLSMLWMLVSGGTAAAAESTTVGSDTAQAVLKSQEIKFFYRSFDTFYTCDGIESKVKQILTALGVKEDFVVEATACDNGRNLSSLSGAQVSIKVTSAIEATPEVLAELAKSRAQRELTARVRGDSTLATVAETQFTAPWKPVSLSRGSNGLDPGDCELVEVMSKEVLPKLGVRVVKKNLRCLGRQGNRTQPQLEVEALMLPPPTPDPAGGAVQPGSKPQP